MHTPSSSQLAPVLAFLATAGAPALITAFARLGLRRATSSDLDLLRHTGRSLGLVDRGEPLRPTRLGYKVMDPLREYLLWCERDQRLPRRSDGRELFDPASLDGAELLEVGSGFGANLMSLERLGARPVGAELDSIYLHFSSVLAERAGARPPRVVCSRGEQLPFGPNAFDVVCCLGALQYMEIPVVVAEMARVLRPGGRLVFVMGTLSAHLRAIARKLRAGSLGGVRGELRTSLDSLSVELTGSVFARRAAQFTTNRPAYPSVAWHRRNLARAGLRVVDGETHHDGRELWLVAERR